MVSFGYNSACDDTGEDRTAAEQLQVTLKGGMVPLLGSLKANLLRQQPPACRQRSMLEERVGLVTQDLPL